MYSTTHSREILRGLKVRDCLAQPVHYTTVPGVLQKSAASTSRRDYLRMGKPEPGDEAAARDFAAGHQPPVKGSRHTNLFMSL